MDKIEEDISNLNYFAIQPSNADIGLIQTPIDYINLISPNGYSPILEQHHVITGADIIQQTNIHNGAEVLTTFKPDWNVFSIPEPKLVSVESISEELSSEKDLSNSLRQENKELKKQAKKHHIVELESLNKDDQIRDLKERLAKYE